MAFRADEATRNGNEEAENFLVTGLRGADESQRAASKAALQDIIDELGPAVDTYPTWHPLVCHHNARHPTTTPGKRCGYEGLDHTRYFVHGFITCPYGDGQEVIDAVLKLPSHPAAHITAERLDVKFYHLETTPVLVKCNWEHGVENDRMIPLRIAMPLILEKEVPCWQWAEVAETWETMRHYFLGSPHGSRSSLFVSQDTGQAIKKIWEALIYTGMFGPIKV